LKKKNIRLQNQICHLPTRQQLGLRIRQESKKENPMVSMPSFPAMTTRTPTSMKDVVLKKQ